MPTPLYISINVINKWEELYQSGLNAVQIAKQFNVHHSTIYYHLNKRIIMRKDGGHIAENHYAWKGQKASSNSIHRWVKKRLPKPELCSECKLRPTIDLANISSKYNFRTYNRDLNNWEWLCRSCHMKKDGRLIKLAIIAKKPRKSAKL